MINFRLLIVEAWKIIWRSPYIWVISLVMSITSLISVYLGIFGIRCITELISWCVFVFGSMELILIVNHLDRNEPIGFKQLLSAGQEIFRRMFSLFLVFTTGGFSLGVTYILLLILTGNFWTEPENQSLSLVPIATMREVGVILCLVPVALLFFLLPVGIYVIFELTLRGMLIHYLRFIKSLGNILAMLRRYTDASLLLSIIVLVLSLLNLAYIAGIGHLANLTITRSGTNLFQSFLFHISGLNEENSSSGFLPVIRR